MNSRSRGNGRAASPRAVAPAARSRPPTPRPRVSRALHARGSLSLADSRRNARATPPPHVGECVAENHQHATALALCCLTLNHSVVGAYGSAPNARDLQGLPLRRRKRELEKLARAGQVQIVGDDQGPRLIDAVARMDLEGIGAKRSSTTHRTRRS